MNIEKGMDERIEIIDNNLIFILNPHIGDVQKENIGFHEKYTKLKLMTQEKQSNGQIKLYLFYKCADQHFFTIHIKSLNQQPLKWLTAGLNNIEDINEVLINLPENYHPYYHVLLNYAKANQDLILKDNISQKSKI